MSDVRHTAVDVTEAGTGATPNFGDSHNFPGRPKLWRAADELKSCLGSQSCEMWRRAGLSRGPVLSENFFDVRKSEFPGPGQWCRPGFVIG